VGGVRVSSGGASGGLVVGGVERLYSRILLQQYYRLFERCEFITFANWPGDKKRRNDQLAQLQMPASPSQS
jgi:hypothetical protein